LEYKVKGIVQSYGHDIQNINGRVPRVHHFTLVTADLDLDIPETQAA